ncbi:MAG: lipid-A-disaccharide [Prolixibacteraceae bacterium]|nr:MAG: lipid-A-disaccharide [Prolixibacteraceae bacterium]
MNNYLVITFGFLAQFLFFARTIVQWFKSEHEGEVISPVIYWQISLLASILMLTYGILRNDFSIVLGQVLVYSVYVRNLQLKKAWEKMHFLTRYLSIIIPALYLGWLIFGENYNFISIIRNDNVTLFLLIWGSAGQVIFTSRFLYQWIYSEYHNDSVLPLGFWIFSTIGSLMIFIYSIPRLDPVLFASHSLGLFMYSRNILLHYGKKGLFSKVSKIPSVKNIIAKVSDKIK